MSKKFFAKILKSLIFNKISSHFSISNLLKIKSKISLLSSSLSKLDIINLFELGGEFLYFLLVIFVRYSATVKLKNCKLSSLFVFFEYISCPIFLITWNGLLDLIFGKFKSNKISLICSLVLK